MSRKKAAALGSLSVLAMAAGTALYQRENNFIQVTKLEMQAAVPAPLRIVLLSDLFGKEFGRRSEKLIQRVTECRPDLIAVTGNLVDAGADSAELRSMANLLEKLNDFAPVFYVSGRSEHKLKDLEYFRNMLRIRGVTVLVNETASVQIGGQRVSILGFDEQEPDLTDRHTMLRDFELQDGFRLLLSSRAERFGHMGSESYRNFSFDLMLSGCPQGKWAGEKQSGLFGDIPKLAVGRGLSAESLPARMLSRPEFVSILVKPAALLTDGGMIY